MLDFYVKSTSKKYTPHKFRHNMCWTVCKAFGRESSALTITWSRPLARVWRGPKQQSKVPHGHDFGLPIPTMRNPKPKTSHGPWSQKWGSLHKFRHSMFGQLVRPLDESQVPSQLHGHGPWLVCDVALNNHLKFLMVTTSDCRPRPRGFLNPKPKTSHGPWSPKMGKFAQIPT